MTNKQPGLCLDSGEFIPAQELNDLHKQETTLAQYIERKTDEPKRITFDKWAEDSQSIYMTIENKEDLYWLLQKTWNAALTKGKL